VNDCFFHSWMSFHACHTFHHPWHLLMDTSSCKYLTFVILRN
jgi:hypothetical protein